MSYKGDNIHSYTEIIKKLIDKHFDDKFYQSIDNKSWESLLLELHLKFPDKKIPLANIYKYYKNGYLLDPQLPKVNIAIILVKIFNFIKTNDDLTNHFRETLEQIGTTCIQGISHRLIIDYIAIIH